MEYLRDNFRCLTGPVNGGQVSLASDYRAALVHKSPSVRPQLQVRDLRPGESKMEAFNL